MERTKEMCTPSELLLGVCFCFVCLFIELYG